MDKVRKLWFAFIAGNIYDVVISFIAWHYHFIELNPIVSFFSGNYFSMLASVIVLKLITISGIYLILKKAKDYAVSILTILVIGIMFAVTWNTLNFLAL